MVNQGLKDLFINALEDMFNAEKQIVSALPKLINLASLQDLKIALSKHLEETKDQVTRLKTVFSLIERKPKEKTCKAMEGLIEEAEELTQNQNHGPTLDAAIIAACQKIEHYEMATYGTLRSFANHLDLGNDIIELLTDSLEEEGAADKKLTKIADGSLFSNGVNKEAAVGQSSQRK